MDENEWDAIEDVEEYIPAAVRKQIPLEDFAWPEKRKYPITSQAHLDSAAKLIGHAPDAMQAKIKARAISIAKRKGFKLPDSWAEEKDGDSDGTAKESLDAQAQATMPFTPRPRIGRIQVRFLHNGAVSKNGRIYPKETVQRLVQSAKEALAAPTPQILTCFTSHAAADMDDVGSLSGKIGDAYQEGEDAFAWLDIPDTTKGRDMVALAQGGYLRNVSIRAKNAQLAMEKGYSLPVVRGNVQLEGIDFTTRPGVDSASIQSVMLEHEGEVKTLERLIDTFDLDVAGVVLEMDEQSAPGELAEKNGAPSGESPWVTTLMEVIDEHISQHVKESLSTASTPASTIELQMDGKKVAQAVIEALDKQRHEQVLPAASTPAGQQVATRMTTEALTLQESLPLIKHHLQEAHGHLHEMCMKAKEAGREFSAANEQKIGKAHDAVALALGIECRYDPECDDDSSTDPDGDGDDDSSADPEENPDDAQDTAQGMYDNGDDPATESTGDATQAKETSEMSITREEALKLLEAEGFDTATLKPKKSKEEQLREDFEARLAAQEAENQKRLAEAQATYESKLDEIKTLLIQSQKTQPEPGRQTMVETNPTGGASGTGQPVRRQNEITRLLREELHPDNWAQIADPTMPLPKNVQPKWGLHIMSQILSGMIELHNHRASQSPLQI